MFLSLRRVDVCVVPFFLFQVSYPRHWITGTPVTVCKSTASWDSISVCPDDRRQRHPRCAAHLLPLHVSVQDHDRTLSRGEHVLIHAQPLGPWCQRGSSWWQRLEVAHRGGEYVGGEVRVSVTNRKVQLVVYLIHQAALLCQDNGSFYRYHQPDESGGARRWWSVKGRCAAPESGRWDASRIPQATGMLCRRF